MTTPQKNKLKQYRDKRDFKKTPEPLRSAGKKSSLKHPLFVVQKHRASHLHYDFRLEINGVLVSWAVPKGPSMDPDQKRLAVMTEDHPLSYATFEGVIPPKQYGAGEVIVWDIGKFSNLKKEGKKKIGLDACLAQGHIEVFLEGEKLKGAYTLVRMKSSKFDEKSWLLIKMQDEFADAKDRLLDKKPNSVLSGFTIEDLQNLSSQT